MAKLRLGVLVSGRGSNLRALIKACKSPDFPAEIALVLSNKPDAPALALAAQEGLSTATFRHQEFSDRASFDAAMSEALKAARVDLICLAGFMRILSPGFVAAWKERILNVHPSLLPKFKGLDTHARAIAAGERESGCTVHLVTADLDEGPILVQRRVPILSTDTPEALAARVLDEEHKAYPEAVILMALRLMPSA